MTHLPIHSILPTLKQALKQQHEVILEAAPGAGKTTLVPLALLEESWLQGQKIIMLEPRRLAAKAAAERMSQLLGETTGTTVGYRIRQESRISQDTRIEVVTEGVFTRMLQTDPSLEGYGLVIFDEFHERSLDTDLGLTLTLEARSIFRQEQSLKLLPMSATLDGDRLAKLLNGAPVVRSEGRSYPVDIIYSRAAQAGEWIVPRMQQAILQALSDHSGSLLCFLPGQNEINQVHTHLLEHLNDENIQITPLYGSLPLAAQRQAIQAPIQGQRKIVLATNIAETSLTIEGIRVVIDSGLMRQSKFNPNNAMDRLYTTRVSQASTIQRAGRAGRTAAGVCYRLWSKEQQSQLPAYSTPDIMQADLAPLALQLAQWGIHDLHELSWLDQPPASAYQQAKDLLQQLGALDAEAKLTAHGEQLGNIAAHPRLAHMLVKAAELGWLEQASLLAALLLEKDPLHRSKHNVQADIQLRIDWLQQQSSANAIAGRIQRQAQQFQRQCQTITNTSEITATESEIYGLLIALAYPDRLAQQADNAQTRYKLSNGRSAAFYNSDSLANHLWLAVAALNSKDQQANDMIALAAPVQLEQLKQVFAAQLEEQEIIDWDLQSGQLIAETQTRLGELIVTRKPLTAPSEAALHKAICDFIRKKGLDLLQWPENVEAWRQRVIFAYQNSQHINADGVWPDLSDQQLLATLETWLTPYLTGVTSVAKLQKLDYQNILLGLLPWPLPQVLEQQVPERYRVPSGSHIRIDYAQSPPVLAVKLQEMFGCVQTPVIAGVALKLHLLSPAQRPLQVTQDLVSFWSNGYKEVQKDMKGRYPKHPWPDDPMTAQATAKTKKASR